LKVGVPEVVGVEYDKAVRFAFKKS